jgi:putative nucleotidyltransferase with HDIG domain
MSCVNAVGVELNTASAALLTYVSGLGPALAGKIVRVANSVLFGHSGQVRDIHQAIMFLGYNRIKSIALGMTVMDVFPYRSSFNLAHLWQHSYEVAFIAGIISEIVPMTSPRECFLAGLLHDIGRIIFYKIEPKRFSELETTDSLFDQERAVFGCTHGEAGAMFAEATDMPSEIVTTIRWHHMPSASSSCREEVAIISLAEAFSRRFRPRLEDDGIWTTEHDAMILEFGLKSSDIDSLGDLLENARADIEDFFRTP